MAADPLLPVCLLRQRELVETLEDRRMTDTPVGPALTLQYFTAGTDGALTPFASGTATFRVRGGASANRAAPAAAVPAARPPFSVAPLSPSAADPIGLHDRRPACAASEKSG